MDNRRTTEGRSKKIWYHKKTAEFTLWTGWEWKFSIRNLDLLTMVLYDHCSLVHLVEHRGSRLLSTAVIVDCSTDVERMLEGLLVMCATRLPFHPLLFAHHGSFGLFGAVCGLAGNLSDCTLSTLQHSVSSFNKPSDPLVKNPPD